MWFNSTQRAEPYQPLTCPVWRSEMNSFSSAGRNTGAAWLSSARVVRCWVAEFLQHSSLKRLGVLYLSTCVGLGYGRLWGLFPGTPSKPAESNHHRQLAASVTTHRPTNIDVVPIGYAFRPRLRDRLTLRRLALRRNPWTFGDSVFHTVCRYSCQHSHFRYLQRPSRVLLRRLTERSATVHASHAP
jgi:hypothetical protein